MELARVKLRAHSAQGGETPELLDQITYSYDGNGVRNFGLAHRKKDILARSSIQPRQTLCIFSAICKSEGRKNNEARRTRCNCTCRRVVMQFALRSAEADQ